MRLIADDDNRVTCIAFFAWAAPELDLVDQSPDQAHHHRKDVRGHLREVNDLDAGIDAIADVTRAEQLFREIVQRLLGDQNSPEAQEAAERQRRLEEAQTQQEEAKAAKTAADAGLSQARTGEVQTKTELMSMGKSSSRVSGAYPPERSPSDLLPPRNVTPEAITSVEYRLPVPSFAS